MSEDKRPPEGERPPSVAQMRRKVREAQKAYLCELVEARDMKDYRISYFDTEVGYTVTAITFLDPSDNKELVVAFSFCSPKDCFSKTQGKINCLERMDEYFTGLPGTHSERPYGVNVIPFAFKHKFLNVALAFNFLEAKPEKLKKQEFFFEGMIFPARVGSTFEHDSDLEIDLSD